MSSELPDRERVSAAGLRNLFAALLLSFGMISGARIASSDALTMYLVTESLVETGSPAIEGANATRGADGRNYSRYGLGNSLLAVPFYLVGKLAAQLAPERFQAYLPRSVVSLCNAWVGALAGVLFFCWCLRLRYRRRTAFWLTIALVFATHFLYATKSFMSEPLQVLCVLGALHAFQIFWDEGRPGWLTAAAGWAAFGVVTKVTLAGLPAVLGLALLYRWWSRRPPRWKHELAAFAVPLLLGAGLVVAYNQARYGGPLNFGYTEDSAAFTTPLFVGLFGLLLSPGKGLFFYAPPVLLALFGAARFWRTRPLAARLALPLIVGQLWLYARFYSWGGDGSWGPRYLLPLLPLCLVGVGCVLEQGRRRAFVLLVLLGMLAQVGGVTIFYGNYLRKLGEFPYERHFSDPLFLYKSHFVPNYSPLVGHWQMLLENLDAHMDGPAIRLTPSDPDSRIPLPDEQRAILLQTIDLWFCYGHYVGVPWQPLLAGLLALLLGAGWCFLRCWRQLRHDSG